MKLEKYKTACGGYFSITERVRSHLTAHPDVIKHIGEAISKVRLPSNGAKLECEVQMGRIIGLGGIVRTSPLEFQSQSLFALRSNRKFPSRVAPLGAVGEESPSIVVIGKPTGIRGEYELITAWIGILARKEPWDPNISSREEFEDCLKFWSSMALVFEKGTMQPVIETSWSEVLTEAAATQSAHQGRLKQFLRAKLQGDK